MIAHPTISTALTGIATVDQFAQASAAVAKGPLPPEALACAAALWTGFAGEPR